MRKQEGYAVLEISGLGFKVLVGRETLKRFPEPESKAKCFCSLYAREDRTELYGFLDEPSMRLFELLCGVSGVGPKSALSILDIDSVENVTAAILERKTDLLFKATGVGKKTAERIVIDLQNKLELSHSAELVQEMKVGKDLEEVLVSLGYQKAELSEVIKEVRSMNSGEEKPFEEQLRGALKMLGEKRNLSR